MFMMINPPQWMVCYVLIQLPVKAVERLDGLLMIRARLH